MKYRHNRLKTIATIIHEEAYGMCPRFRGTTFVVYTRSNNGDTPMVMEHMEFYKEHTLIEDNGVKES